MTFSPASGKAPASTARPTANGAGHAAGKRPLPAATSSHAQGSASGQNVAVGSSSNAEERERVKGFWLNLNDRDRRNLIKVEKDQVLRRMREQQKHGCTCSVCMRKRRSIEDELDVLYDAYYSELEVYANQQQKHSETNGQIPAPIGPGPFPGSVELDSNGAVIGGNALIKATARRGHGHHHPQPLGKRAALPPEDEDAYDDDELEDDEYDDEYEYEDEEDEEDDLDEADVKTGARRRGVTSDLRSGATRPPGAGAGAAASNGDFLSIGTSLTVKGILTVADDLLRNDGQKFLEMMEQLAERRAQREDESRGGAADTVVADTDGRDDDVLDDEDELEEVSRIEWQGDRMHLWN